MELRYDNSFGGEGFKKNPVGKGLTKVEIKTGDNLVALPNILHFGEKITSQSTKLEPAGFGPYNLMWPQRYSKIGTYKGNYLKERWPWFAKDFDWGFFNSAPYDMQVSGYLKGNENLYFENLHPVHSNYHSKLPGIRIRCFKDENVEKKSVTSHEKVKKFEEIKMNLDTLWVDMENEKLILVWRGVTEIQSEEYEEIDNIYLVSEKLADEPNTTDFYKLELEKMLKEKDKDEFEEIETEKQEEKTEADKEVALAEEQMRASLVEAGIDPDTPPEKSEEDKNKEAELLKEMGIEEDANVIPLTREIIVKRAENKESFDGEDLRNIDLSNLDLQGLSFKETILNGVNLKNSNLSNSDFTGANLIEADLSASKLNNAVLINTDLTKAFLNNSDLSGSILEESIFENASLINCNLSFVNGKNSFFGGADLTGSVLIKSEFQKADFSNSTLNKTNFSQSILSEAAFENVVGIESDFTKADLTKLKAAGSKLKKSIFKEVIAPDINLSSADLSETDFSYSKMEAGLFTSSLMENANLFAADMKFARLNKTNLTSAKLIKMNLFQGTMEKANLNKTDCSGSNFYGVEFLDTIVKDTKFQFTNLKMTKLSK